MEKVVAQKSLTETLSPTDSTGTLGSDYQHLLDKNQNFQKQVLQLSEENINLKFKVEQANKDLPRLKDRISDLQKYVEVLKAENNRLLTDQGANGSLESAGSAIGKVESKIAESGKSTQQLENTIVLLKKVVERVQSENVQLKKAPGIVSNKRLQNLQVENERLKSQLQELQQKMGSTLSERYTSQQKGTAKLMVDYEKMRKDFMKEMDSKAKLQSKVATLELKLEQLKNQTVESKTLHNKESSSDNAEGKGLISAVATSLYECKIKSLESELDKKSKLLSDAKIILKDAVIKEQKLVAEKDQLLKTIVILEKMAKGTSVMSDTDIVREYQQAKLTIDRLENEKNELRHELTITRCQAGAGHMSEDIFAKASAYDKAMLDVIELGLQLKTVQYERDRTKLEVERLTKEHSKLSPKVFDEIEDLKFKYKQSVEKNIQYLDKLKVISDQFGISIPGIR